MALPPNTNKRGDQDWIIRHKGRKHWYREDGPCIVSPRHRDQTPFGTDLVWFKVNAVALGDLGAGGDTECSVIHDIVQDKWEYKHG